MNYKLLIVLISALFLNACGPTPEDIVSNKAVTERNLSNPEIIGKTYDGQTVKRSIIKYQCEHCDSPSNHFIYFVGNVKSDNYLVQSGKVAYNNVDVTLPEKPTAEDILNKAKEIQEQQGQQKQKDEAELKKPLQRIEKAKL